MDSGTPLPPVSARDLERVCNLLGAESRPAVGFDYRLIERECEPGADVMSVFLRAALLRSILAQGSVEPRAELFERMARYPIPDGVRALDLPALLAHLRA